MKVAIIHYWLLRMRGGEKVVEALCELYPDADIFTHVSDRQALSPTIQKHRIQTTFIAKLPNAKKWYKNYLPFMPLALEQLDLSDYDLVISTESGPAKGVITRPDALHICYCHTPMRYVWDMYHDYLAGQFFLKQWLMRPILHYIRNWDSLSSNRVDHFISNSHYVAQRIQKFYKRDATVIPPPVDVDSFSPSSDKQDYYLLLGQLVAYKRADLAVDAFNKSGKKLIIIGDGEMSSELAKRANDNIEFLGWLESKDIQTHLRNAKALLFPGIEDFGIVPLEAMASGTPVIAFARGGALETVIDEKTGVYFHHQSVDALNEAVEKIESGTITFDSNTLVAHANSFSKANFKQKISTYVDEKLKQFNG